MNKLFSALMLVLIALSWGSCHKELDVKDPVVSDVEMAVSGAQAHFSWCVDFTGSFQTGVELNPNENMTELRRVEATKEGDRYVAIVDDLSMGTKYYCRIVVWNKLNNYEQEMKSFTTSPAFAITLACNPEEGGTATGGGTYIVGDTCTVVATANVGYNFANWTENGNQVSTDSVYAFAVTGDRTLVANFQAQSQPQSYTISVSAEPSNGGTVTGGGSYSQGASCTVTATANTGYFFNEWYEIIGDSSGEIMVTASIDSIYTFTVTDNRTLKASFTQQTSQSYTISVSAIPSNGGTVTGGGTYQEGQSCTVTAVPADGYTFTCWYEEVIDGGGGVGVPVSIDSVYTFTVTDNRTLKASFTQQSSQSYTISVSANPSNGGTVTGGGTYQEGQSCTVTAVPADGYTFSWWYEVILDEGGGSLVPVSSDANYIFTVNSDRTLMTDFTYNGGDSAPQGAINGKFSVSDSQQVYFSQGNLQYNKITQVWSFMEHQYDMVETQGQNVGENYANQNIISLFGWGTSGWNNGNVYYQPYDTQNNGNISQGHGYGPTDGTSYTYNLTGTYANADWGVYRAISNGGGQAGQWRTLTMAEWDYVFTGRSGALSKYGHGKVNGVNGMILLPDEWTLPSGLSFTSGISSWANVYTTEQWEQMQQNGAVFLPAAGYREGTSVIGGGYYWSASYFYSSNACTLYFHVGGVFADDFSRYYGQSVRLVAPAEN